jgi:hypothetical protein
VSLLVAVGSPASADVPMFFVLFEAKMLAWWTIPACVAIEAAALRWIFKPSWKRAFSWSLIANFATFFIGSILYIPIILVVARTMSVVGAGGLVLEPALIILTPTIFDTLAELLLLRMFFGVVPGWGSAGLFMLANLLTTLILLAALFVGA